MHNEKMEKFENAVIALIKRKPFFGHLLMTMRREFSTKIPTAGVSVTSKGVNLIVNLDFLAQMSLEGRMAVLEHEALHILHAHPVRHKRIAASEAEAKNKTVTPDGKEIVFDDKMIFNVAADCAINQYLKDFNQVTIDGKPVGVTIETLQPHVKQLLERNQHSEYYYALIKKDAADKVASGELQPMDDHSEWENSDLTEEQAEGKIKGHLKVAKDMSNGVGLSSSDQEALAKILQSNIDWRAQLRNFTSNAVEVLVEATRKKRNKRYGIVYPGQKVEPKFSLAVCVDTSGSMAGEIDLVFAEVRKIADNPNVSVHVIEADCEVKNCYQYKKHMEIKPRGFGGTAYQPAFDKAMELKVDAIIYLNDGDPADTPRKPNVPVLWAMVRGNQPCVPWGRVIQVKAIE